jgi:hypothetical protein
VREGRRRQAFDRWIIRDLAVLDDPAVAVIGVLAQTDVGHHAEVRDAGFDRLHRSLNDSIPRVGA